MKKTILILIIGAACVLSSCGHGILKTKEDAIKFIESNKFYDESAEVTGGTGAKLTTPFGISFSNGNAIIGNETLPYTIDEVRSGSFCGGKEYLIKVCGNQQYAYGECIKCHLCSGIKADGSTDKTGPSLNVRGSNIKAFFSYISDGAITKK